MRYEAASEAMQRETLGGIEPLPHSLIGVASLAWPGMVVEVEVTAAVPIWKSGSNLRSAERLHALKPME